MKNNLKRKRQKSILKRLSEVSVVLLGIIFILISCDACHKKPMENNKLPVISSFTLNSVTMTSAELSYIVSNYETLQVAIKGGETKNVSGSNYSLTNLLPNTNYEVSLIATGGGKSVTKTLTFTTLSSNLKIDSFKVNSVTESSVSFNFATSSNASITEETIKNENTGQVIDVKGLNTYNFTNLSASTDYTFTLNVKDNTGNSKFSSLVAHTLDKKSTWLKNIELVYANPFAIDRNAQSNLVTLKVTNNSASVKTLNSMVLDFGDNGAAVKMLRYRQQDTAKWTILQLSGTKVELKNLVLAPGVNSIPSYFAIKKDVGSISNNAPLTMRVVSIDDGEGGKLPSDGSFNGAIDVGRVNTTTDPSEIVMPYGLTYQPTYGSIWIGSNGSADPLIAVIGFYFNGPNGAKLKSVRLYNPYYQFSGLVYSNWLYIDARVDGSLLESVNNIIWESGQKYLTLTPKDSLYNKLNNLGSNFNKYYFSGSIYNGNSSIFDSNNYTTGEYEWFLLSPFDIITTNSDGQIIDVSDVSVSRHG